MYPILFRIGSFEIAGYGFMIVLGFLAAYISVRWFCTQAKLDYERVVDMGFITTVVGILGARILYVITQPQEFYANPLDVVKFWEGGLVFFGGPLLAAPFGIWLIRRMKLPIWLTSDVFMPSIVIAHAFGRVGCFLAGCCYGIKTDFFLAMKFDTEMVEADFRGIPVHPTQLYEAVALVILYFGLVWVFKRRKFDGQVVLTYFLAYPVIRSMIEIVRGDIIRGWVIEDYLSTSQFISIIVFIVAAGFLKYRLDQVALAGVARPVSPAKKRRKSQAPA